jgi:hypothetical protein
VRTLLPLAALLLPACAVARGAARHEPSWPAAPLDAIIVPGCPMEEGGALSRCALGRALWAAVLVARGAARNVIVSGAAVHTPYLEAEGMALVLAALGVDGARIHLEPNALHTDENMFFSLQIARARGFHTLGVASSRGHARSGCAFLESWGQPCVPLALDQDAVRARHVAARGRLDALRVPEVPRAAWLPLAARERRLCARDGRPRRPPSYLLYAQIGIMRTNGERWVPYAPVRPPLYDWPRWQATPCRARLEFVE